MSARPALRSASTTPCAAVSLATIVRSPSARAKPPSRDTLPPELMVMSPPWAPLTKAPPFHVTELLARRMTSPPPLSTPSTWVLSRMLVESA